MDDASHAKSPAHDRRDACRCRSQDHTIVTLDAGPRAVHIDRARARRRRRGVSSAASPSSRRIIVKRGRTPVAAKFIGCVHDLLRSSSRCAFRSRPTSVGSASRSPIKIRLRSPCAACKASCRRVRSCFARQIPAQLSFAHRRSCGHRVPTYDLPSILAQKEEPDPTTRLGLAAAIKNPRFGEQPDAAPIRRSPRTQHRGVIGILLAALLGLLSLWAVRLLRKPAT